MNTLLVFIAIFLVAFIVFALADEFRMRNASIRRWKSNYANLYSQMHMNTLTPTQVHNELETLIAATKGKFFSITFTKKDGSTRVINGKDKYRRLLAGGSNTVRQAGYVPFVNRNTETWVSAHKDQVVTFSCGKINKSMKVSG